MIPALSVVMPVHNARPYLDEAIGSIVGQSFRDFEFVILDDGSTDGSGELLRVWADKDARIRLVTSSSRSGPAGSSNRVVAESRAALVARMDADDIAHPDRLRRQMELFRCEPDAVLAGVLHDTVDENGRCVRPADIARATRRSLFPPFNHGSVMMRRWAFEAVGGYRGACDYWEDIDLYLRMARVGRILVIPEPLFSYRLSATSVRLVSASDMVLEAYDRMYDCLDHHRERRTYDALLSGRNAGRLSPRAFALLGSSAVWAGRTPRLAGLFVRRARLGLNGASLRALAWIIWASLGPRSLRLFLRALLHIRTGRSAHAAGERWLEWTSAG